MSEKTYYCHLDSGGDVETNLQLFFLKKAYDEWCTLSKCYSHDGNNTKNLKERLVSIVSNIGLSLSQLLGQNTIQVKEKLDNLEKLLSTILNEYRIDKEQKKSLNRRFSQFIQYYDACRHFGRVEGNVKWGIIDSLNYELVLTFMETTLEIWNIIIDHHKGETFEVRDIQELLEYTRLNYNQ